MELKNITISLVHNYNNTNIYDVLNAVYAEQQLGSDVAVVEAFVKTLPYQPFNETARDYVISGSSQNLARLLTRIFP